MNLLDPVKWGAQAAFTVTSTAVKLGVNAVRTAELLLGRDSVDDAEQRFHPVATPVPRTPARTPARAPDPTPTVPRGERLQTSVEPPVPEGRFRRDEDAEPDRVVESEGTADPGASLRVDEPFKGYDELRAQEIVERVRQSDDATKAVVRLYEQTHKKRKTVLAATDG